MRAEVMAILAGGVTDFDGFLDANPDFIVEVRRRHAVVDANRRALELFDVPNLRALQRQVSSLWPADIVSNGKVLRAIANGARFCEGERVLRRTDGHVVPIIWRANLPQDGTGFDRLYMFAFDISEQKLAQEALVAACANLNHVGRLSLVGELTASLAHEVAQPISSIANNAAAAHRWMARGRSAEVAKGLSRIASNAEHAGEVVQRIKRFSRRALTDRVVSDSRTLILEAMALTQFEARRHGASLEINAAEDLPGVLADPTQIQQVLVNLIINSLQATAGVPAEHHKVRVLAKIQSPGFVSFQVEDTGSGIAPEDLERVFEPFYSTKSEGVGLGLSICRRIIDEHGGRLWAQARPQGAVFSFCLPLAEPGQASGS